MKDEPFNIPDEVIDRHFQGGGAAVEDPADADPPEGFDQDNPPNEDPEFNLEDKDEEYAGVEDDFDDLDDEPPAEEDDEFGLREDEEEFADDLEGEPEGGEDADPILDKLTRKEIEEIKADPRLAKAHRLMHGRFTEAMQELREREQGIEAQASEVRDFLAEVRTEEGAVALVQTYAMNNPGVLSRAFKEAFEGSEKQAEFLVDLALEDPEVIREALDQVEVLHADPERLDTRRERQKLARERAEIERDKAARNRQYASQRSHEVRSWMDGYAERAQIPEEERATLEQRIIGRIRENRAQTGRGDITKEDVRRLTVELRDEVKAREDQVRERLKRQERERRNRRRQDRVRAPSRPRPPSSGGAPRARAGRLKAPKGVDPLDHALDTAFDRLGE